MLVGLVVPVAISHFIPACSHIRPQRSGEGEGETTLSEGVLVGLVVPVAISHFIPACPT